MGRESYYYILFCKFIFYNSFFFYLTKMKISLFITYIPSDINYEGRDSLKSLFTVVFMVLKTIFSTLQTIYLLKNEYLLKNISILHFKVLKYLLKEWMYASFFKKLQIVLHYLGDCLSSLTLVIHSWSALTNNSAMGKTICFCVFVNVFLQIHFCCKIDYVAKLFWKDNNLD